MRRMWLGLLCAANLMFAPPPEIRAAEKETSQDDPLRTWTDDKGRQVEARLVEVKEKRVVLKKEDGTELTVSLDKLSSKDRAYAKKTVTPEPRAAAPRARGEKPAKHETITNSIGMQLTLVPSGEFMMGSGDPIEALTKLCPTTPEKYFKLEFPQHRVRITKPFYFGTYEVTVAQFRKFVDKTDYKTNAETSGKGGSGFEKGWLVETPKPEFTWKSWGIKHHDNHPVTNVSWHDANAFCKWLSDTEHKKYRLPTEAEWEYACRAGSKTQYHFGDDPEGLALIDNVADSEVSKILPGIHAIRASDGVALVSPVGKFRPNAFGLYDMHGNASEWCTDHCIPFFNVDSPVDDPTGPRYRPEQADLAVMAFRGGCFVGCPDKARSSARLGQYPSRSICYVGFRVICEK